MNQLAQLASDWRGTMPTDGMLAEQKIDGWRALRFAGIDGKVHLFTRNGMPIEGIGHILKRLSRMQEEYGAPLFFDGELQVDGSLEATKKWCESGWKQGGNAGVFHAFDAMPLSEWRRGGWDMPMQERKSMLNALIRKTEPDPDEWMWPEGSRGAPAPIDVVAVEDTWVFNPADAVDEAQRMWARDLEGVMLKDPMAPYERKRSDAWLKVTKMSYPKWCREVAA